MSLLEYIAQIGGIGAVFAIIMFWIYRHDRADFEKRMSADRKFMEDRLTTVLNDYSDDCRKHAEAFSSVREALNELTIWLKAKNGH